MPSPLAHASLALLAAPALAGRERPSRARTLALWALVACFLVLPDADILAGWIATGDAFGAHGTWSHSFLLAPLAGLAFAALARAIAAVPPRRAFLIGTACYASHVALDAITRGRGVCMLWPLVPDRIGTPVTIFSGVRHSEPGNLAAHARTLAEESVFALAVALVAFAVARLARPRTGATP